MSARTISNGLEVMTAHSFQTTLQLIRHRRQRFNSLTMDKACFNEEINFGEISILGFYRPFLIKGCIIVFSGQNGGDKKK